MYTLTLSASAWQVPFLGLLLAMLWLLLLICLCWSSFLLGNFVLVLLFLGIVALMFWGCCLLPFADWDSKSLGFPSYSSPCSTVDVCDASWAIPKIAQVCPALASDLARSASQPPRQVFLQHCHSLL